MSLNTFFNPKIVAVIGVSKAPNKIGATIFRNFLYGWKGTVIPINPTEKTILKQKSYSSVLDYPGKIDHAVVAVPAAVVPKVLSDCVEKGVSSVVIISSGFSEIGKTELEQNLKDILKASRTRVVGPNCLGIYDAFSNANSVFLPLERFKLPGKGKISVISQSGAVGSILLDILADESIGISKFVSYGNAIDVNEADLIEFLSKDKSTDVIVGYVESVKDGPKFMSACRNSKKPVVLLKAGRHEETGRAIQSHTGSLAGSYEVYSGALRQIGAAQVEDWESLLDVAKAYLQPTPKGSKILILTDGGGFGILAADAATEHGLKLPLPSKDITKKLKDFPEYTILENPMDLSGDATAERYSKALEAALKADEYDAIVIIALWQIPTLGEAAADEIIRLNKKYKTPFYCIGAGSDYSRKITLKLERNGVPVYPTPSRAMKAISKVV